MKNMTPTKAREELEALKSRSDSDLVRAVISDVIEDDDPVQSLREVCEHGAQSGAVSSLIYYADTRAFYAKHADDIDEIRQELEESTGEPLRIGYPTYNWLAWLGYEETARKVLDTLGIEL